MGAGKKTPEEESQPDKQTDDLEELTLEDGKPNDEKPLDKTTENGLETEADIEAEHNGGEQHPDGYQPLFKRNPWLLRCLVASIVIFIVLVMVAIIVIFVVPMIMSYYTPPMKSTNVEILDGLQNVAPFNKPRSLSIPEGFGIQAIARVPNARFLLVLPSGDVLVSQPKDGKISLLSPSYVANVSRPRTDFAVGLKSPQDMILYTDDNGDQFIYVAQETRVTRHPYQKGDTRLGRAEVVADNLPFEEDYENPHKGIAIGNGSLYVSIGSYTDSNPVDLVRHPKRGAIYGYSPEGKGARLVSEGIRSAEGLAFAPGRNDLWAVVKQRKNIKYPFIDQNKKYGVLDPEFVDYNPPEEMIRVIEGKNFGWPYCNHNVKVGGYVPDFASNPNETEYKCSIFQKVDFTLPPHSTPLGLTFWTGENAPSFYKGGAIVSLYDVSKTGEGNSIIFVPFYYGNPVYHFTLVSGWFDKETNDAWGKPVDTAVMEDGSILISEDKYGFIYRLYPRI